MATAGSIVNAGRLAQLDRALASGAEGCRFESCIARMSIYLHGGYYESGREEGI